MPSPRLESFGPLRLVGLMRPHKTTYDNGGVHRVMAAQWHDFITQRVGTAKANYGVFGCMADGATHFDYFCGAPSETALPQGFVVLDLPLLRCAVFPYTGPVWQLRDFVRTVFSHELPAIGLSLLPVALGTPEFIERYWDDFDHSAIEGGLDVLVPVQT